MSFGSEFGGVDQASNLEEGLREILKRLSNSKPLEKQEIKRFEKYIEQHKDNITINNFDSLKFQLRACVRRLNSFAT